MACIATLAGFLGRHSWFLDLFSHFRLQYLAGLLGVGLLLAIGRRRVAAAGMLVFAGINLAVMAPHFVGWRPVVPDGVSSARVMMFNVNTRRGDPVRARRAIEEADPDIVVLAEIDARWVADLHWLHESHPHVCLMPREDNFGIGLFSRLPLAGAEVVHAGEAGVPSIVARVHAAGDIVTVIATHPLPPDSAGDWRLRNDQLARLPELVPASGPVLLLGDLNTTPWNYFFRRLLRTTGLRDSARGFGAFPTWLVENPLMAIPLDHCLHSPDVAILRRRVGPPAGSDHRPLIVEFAVSYPRRMV
jgi:endonuclease/exonuclease/phosphatase (EEP) superfamily protein YafD